MNKVMLLLFSMQIVFASGLHALRNTPDCILNTVIRMMKIHHMKTA